MFLLRSQNGSMSSFFLQTKMLWAILAFLPAIFHKRIKFTVSKFSSNVCDFWKQSKGNMVAKFSVLNSTSMTHGELMWVILAQFPHCSFFLSPHNGEYWENYIHQMWHPCSPLSHKRKSNNLQLSYNFIGKKTCLDDFCYNTNYRSNPAWGVT